MRSLASLSLLAALAGSAAVPALSQSNDDDLRRYGHGLDLLPRDDGKYWLIWSSPGNPPTGDWTHDIFYSLIDPAKPVIAPVKLISNPEAQEPASSALSADGHVFITMEDGWNTCCEVAQRYGVYDRDLKPVLPYPQMVQDGGHSGHVAASGNRFVVFYSDDWVNGGGVDDLGTGDDVIAMVYSADGKLERRRDVAVGKTNRDWWPLVAASGSRACLVWQRYVAGQIHSDLHFSLIDPATGNLLKDAVRLEAGIRYYHYSVEYLASIDRFLVRGTYHAGGGFGFLIDGDGKVTAENRTLPAMVRASQSIPRDAPGGMVVAQPQLPSGISLIMATANSLTAMPSTPDTYLWQYGGADGVFTSASSVFIASHSSKGIVAKQAELPLPTALDKGPVAPVKASNPSPIRSNLLVDGKGRRTALEAVKREIPVYRIDQAGR